MKNEVGGSGEKTPSKDMDFFFPNLSQSFFLLENLTQWGMETAVCPIFAKPVSDIFAVCLLVPRTNLSHTQQRAIYAQKSKVTRKS